MGKLVFKPEGRFRRPFCKRGHDKIISGVTDSNRCYECQKEDSRKYHKRYWRKKHAHRPPYRPDPKVICERIEEVRLYVGMDKRSFYKKLGVAETAIRYWGRGIRRPNPSTLERLFPALTAVLEEKHEEIRRVQEQRAERERFDRGSTERGGRPRTHNYAA